MEQLVFTCTRAELRLLIKSSLIEAIKESKLLEAGQKSRLLAIKKAAEKFDTTTRFIYKLHAEGKINLKKLNKRTYVDVVELEESMTVKDRE